MMSVMGAVMVVMMFHRLFGVMHGVQVMPVRSVRVMGGLVMRAGIMMFRRFVVVFGGGLVMLGSLAVVIRALMRA